MKSAICWVKEYLEPSMKGGVAVKFIKKTEDTKYINFPKTFPLEVALLILANEGPRVPQIIQLLDWKDLGEYYIVVLERPVPCEDLFDFVQRHGGRIDEELARVIMWQATQAAYMSCQRGVLHRDIKQENLLINKDTLEVKLIDFGCGDLLQSVACTTFMGTRMYCPPEFLSEGKYHGEPATVYSLGVLLFSLICGTFPDSHDKIMNDLNRWFIAGLSQECCQLICSCLQRDPKKRLDLGKILHHEWFKGTEMKKIGIVAIDIAAMFPVTVTLCVGVNDRDADQTNSLYYNPALRESHTWNQLRQTNTKIKPETDCTDWGLNTRGNEGNQQDTPESNDIIKHEGKLGHGEHMGRENTTKQVHYLDSDSQPRSSSFLGGLFHFHPYKPQKI